MAFVPSKDLLIQIKPKLSGDKANDPTLVTQLHGLANLAESFTEQRPRSNKTWLHLADNLDREGEYLCCVTFQPFVIPVPLNTTVSPHSPASLGVNLWNTSGIIRQGKDQRHLKLFAAREYNPGLSQDYMRDE